MTDKLDSSLPETTHTRTTVLEGAEPIDEVVFRYRRRGGGLVTMRDLLPDVGERAGRWTITLTFEEAP